MNTPKVVTKIPFESDVYVLENIKKKINPSVLKIYYQSSSVTAISYITNYAYNNVNVIFTYMPILML